MGVSENGVRYTRNADYSPMDLGEDVSPKTSHKHTHTYIYIIIYIYITNWYIWHSYGDSFIETIHQGVFHS